MALTPSSASSQILSAKSSADALAARLKALQGENTDGGKRLQTIETRLKSATSTSTSLNSQLSTLEKGKVDSKEITTLETNMTTVERLLKSIQTGITQLTGSNSGGILWGS